MASQILHHFISEVLHDSTGSWDEFIGDRVERIGDRLFFHAVVYQRLWEGYTLALA